MWAFVVGMIVGVVILIIGVIIGAALMAMGQEKSTDSKSFNYN